MIFPDLLACKIWCPLYVHLNAQCHYLPPCVNKNIVLATNGLSNATTSNTAPSSIFVVTNSTAILPNYHTPDTAQPTIVHPSIAHPSIKLPTIAHQNMVQPSAASDGAAFNGTAA